MKLITSCFTGFTSNAEFHNQRSRRGGGVGGGGGGGGCLNRFVGVRWLGLTKMRYEELHCDICIYIYYHPYLCGHTGC